MRMPPNLPFSIERKAQSSVAAMSASDHVKRGLRRKLRKVTASGMTCQLEAQSIGVKPGRMPV